MKNTGLSIIYVKIISTLDDQTIAERGGDQSRPSTPSVGFFQDSAGFFFSRES